MECLPGDSISLRASLFGRMATPLKPLLDNLHCETFFFFTPSRQVWPDFVKMHGEQENPNDSIDFVIPTISVVAAEGSIFDYYGIPTGVTLNYINALPFRIYNHIFNNWFRDQNLVDQAVVAKDAGPDDNGNYQILHRRKRKDYFTSCLPWPQKNEDTSISLGDRAPVIGIGVATGLAAQDGTQLLKETSGEDTYTNYFQNYGGDGSQLFIEGDGGDGIAAYPQIFADLSQADGISINDLRESIQIQRLLERDARGGTRYPELLRSHFGVTDPMMLVHQRPVFLGGGHTMINVSPVAQTTQTSTDAAPNFDNSPQGNLAAYATIQANNHGFTYSATEHGYITGIVNVRADLTYQQGLERYWSRSTRFDYFYPALGHLGEMAVLNKELFAQGTADDDLVFGYQEAWADYRYIPSKITGLFRSAATASLDVWHLAQDFGSLPTLNKTFIEDAVPMDRVVAVPSEPDFLLDVYFKIKAARPLPLYGTPGMMDHF